MGEDPSAEQVRAFLVDLTALTVKHGIAIGGCGCCNSPWLLGSAEKGGRYHTNPAGERLVFIEAGDK